MIQKPIYEPKGRANEYGSLACNIYTGCNHKCFYCYAPGIARKTLEGFAAHVHPRHAIVESVKRQLEREKITGKLIHLCFTCDPYPAEIDTAPTREVIRAIKEAGNNVQILTKGGLRAERDFDLLGAGDWFGVTLCAGTAASSKNEPGAATVHERILSLNKAHSSGIKTWVSCEPVLDEEFIYQLIEVSNPADGADLYPHIDLFRIGKMNHRQFGINWAEFGAKCEALCIEHGRDYFIKADLRNEMRKGGAV